MIARFGSRRRLGGVLTLLYLLVGVAVPIVHSDRDAPLPAEAHLDPWGEDDCAPRHDELHCPGCKLGTVKLGLVGSRQAALSPVGLAARRSEAARRPPGSPSLRLPGSRAPPRG